MRRITVLVMSVLAIGCGDREEAILLAANPAADVGSLCGVWNGAPSPGDEFIGATTVVASPAPAAGGASIDTWAPGANPWGYAWDGYVTFETAVPSSCHARQFSIGSWNQNGNLLTVESYQSNGGPSRFDLTGVAVQACGEGYAGDVFCSANLPPDQMVIEAVVHDRTPPSGCPDRYHLAVRFQKKGSTCP